MRTKKEYDDPMAPADRILRDASVPEPYKRRIREDMDECRLIPLKEAVNLRMKELLALAEKEGRNGRFSEDGA